MSRHPLLEGAQSCVGPPLSHGQNLVCLSLYYRTSKVVHQHADGHARFFIAQIVGRDQQHNGISGWPDLHSLLSQRVYGVFSRELAHCLPTPRGNATSMKPPKKKGWLLRYGEYCVFLAQLFN
jgi:hypothetical protein